MLENATSARILFLCSCTTHGRQTPGRPGFGVLRPRICYIPRILLSSKPYRCNWSCERWTRTSVLGQSTTAHILWTAAVKHHQEVEGSGSWRRLLKSVTLHDELLVGFYERTKNMICVNPSLHATCRAASHTVLPC